MQGTTFTTSIRRMLAYTFFSTNILVMCAIACPFSGHAIAGAPATNAEAKPTAPAPWLHRSPASKSQHNLAKSLDKGPLMPIVESWNTKFGLRTTFAVVDGVHGERIDHVELGSLAKEMKLSTGDFIVAVNGIPFSDPDSSRKTMGRAVRLGGWLTLKVRLCHSGAVAYRTGNLASAGKGY